MSYTYPIGGGPLQPAQVSYKSFSLTADVTLYWPFNFSDTANIVPLFLDATSDAARAITMPAANNASNGQAVIINNTGSYTITIKDSTGSTITTVAAGVCKYVIIRDNSTAAGLWRVFTMGTGTSAADAAALAGQGLKAISSLLNVDAPANFISTTYTIIAADRGEVIVWTGGAGTINLTAASTLTNGFYCSIRNRGSGNVTLDAAGTDLINGAGTIVLSPGDSCVLHCTNTAGNEFITIGLFRSDLGFDYIATSTTVNVPPVATGSGTNLAIGDSAVVAGNGTPGAIAIGCARASTPGSVAIAIGDNTSSYGALGSSNNVAIGYHAKASGSQYNTAIGGTTNTASGTSASTVIGGTSNTASGNSNSTVVGGSNNTASSTSDSTVVGGSGNTAAAIRSAVVGGNNNTVTAGSESVIVGGKTNSINGTSTHGIFGGEANTVTGTGYNSIVGGYSNEVTATLGSGAYAGNENAVSGSLSACLAGDTNTVSMAYATCLGGNLNTINGSGNFAGILGGYNNTASGSYAAIITGDSCTASGTNSLATGKSNTASGAYSIATGRASSATRQGQFAHASDGFAAVGDAQTSRLVMRNSTSNGTQTELFTNGSSERLVLPNDTTWTFIIYITARRTDADNESASYKIEGCIDRNGNAASTALVGTITKTVIAEDTAAWDVDAVADTTNGALAIKVTGEAAKTIRWVARVILVEVTG